MTKLWFVMYAGSSADGTGPGYYFGRTEELSAAIAFLRTHVEGDPYAVGYVRVFSDNEEMTAYTVDRLRRISDDK